MILFSGNLQLPLFRCGYLKRLRSFSKHKLPQSFATLHTGYGFPLSTQASPPRSTRRDRSSCPDVRTADLGIVTSCLANRTRFAVQCRGHTVAPQVQRASNPSSWRHHSEPWTRIGKSGVRRYERVGPPS